MSAVRRYSPLALVALTGGGLWLIVTLTSGDMMGGSIGSEAGTAEFEAVLVATDGDEPSDRLRGDPQSIAEGSSSSAKPTTSTSETTRPTTTGRSTSSTNSAAPTSARTSSTVSSTSTSAPTSTSTPISSSSTTSSSTPSTTAPTTTASTAPTTVLTTTTMATTTTSVVTISTLVTTTLPAGCYVELKSREDLYDAPSDDANEIGRARVGPHPVVGNAPGWVQIDADGLVGWVRADRVRKYVGDC